MRASLIGVDVEDLQLPIKDAVRRAAEMTFEAIEIPATVGDTSPRSLSPSGRRHLARFVEDLGLKLAALTADMPGLRLTDPRRVSERVERTCEIIDLARELHVPLVTAAVGALTHPETGEPSALSLAALRRIAEYADSRGVVYAMRPSHDNRERLERVLSELGSPSMRIGLDPAAMIMSGTSSTALLQRLADQVALVHARDATAGLTDRPGVETRLGEGEVDFVGLVTLLKDADFAGSFIARRLTSQAPIADLSAARERLIRLLRP